MRTKVDENNGDLINKINFIYTSLQNLSNEKLRSKVKEIEQLILNSENQQEELESHLPEVYAIVKDTARRFSEGDILVCATPLDRKLAQEVDYLTIEGDTARYRNCWNVDGQDFNWNMIHYDEQLMGGIYLHFGYATEMATGEGKTLVATLPSFLNGLSHKGVYVMTVNNYLSRRDYEITRPIYSFLGLTTACIEIKPDSRDYKKEAYKADIVFGTCSTFTFDYLFDHLALSPDDCVMQRHNFAIIDEIDSILIDEAVTPHIVGGGKNYDRGEIYKKYFPIVKELIENQDMYEANTQEKSASFTSVGIEWLKNKLGIPTLYDVRREYEIPEFESLTKEKKNRVHNIIEIQNVLHHTLKALTVFQRDVDYLVEDDTIKIIDSNTGRIKEHNRWQHGLHTAIEVKEKVEIKCDSDSIAVISLKNYFRLYNSICGMSGTIMSVKDELLETYGLKSKSIPTHKTCIRKDLPLRIYKTESEKEAELIQYIISNKSEGRPSLVCSGSVMKSEQLGESLSKNELEFNTLNAKTTKGEAAIIAKAGKGNTITIATSVAGRGTDIKPSEDALECGGLAVIGSDYFESIRVERQLRGRTSRQGDPGTSVFYTSLEDPILNYLGPDDKEALTSLLDNITDNNYSIPELAEFFAKAQHEREEGKKYSRKRIAMKDDIIDPHRKRFYKERNTFLLYPHEAERFIEKLIGQSGISRQAILNHIEELHIRALRLSSRSRRNNMNRISIDIPFSDNQYLFTLKLDINKIEDFNYFSKEFRKTVFLQTYDAAWKRFVTHAMGDLDQNEIRELDKKFSLMKQSVCNELINRMLNSVIPYSQSGSVDDATPADGKDCRCKMNRIEIPADTPCPCGSGKKYCECHGSNIRNARLRPRR